MLNGNEMSQIQPLCDKHTNVRMQPGQLEGRANSGEPVWYGCYKCPRDGCSRCYTAGDGYFDPSSFPLIGHHCPDHELFMYLQSPDTWRCPEIGCERIL